MFSPGLTCPLGWITYATAGVMQGSLLVMCLLWKARQARLHIDDFGNKLGPDVPAITVINGDSDDMAEDVIDDIIVRDGVAERTPLLGGPRDAAEGGKKKGLWGWVFFW